MSSREWWQMPLSPALGREKQSDLCDSEVTLVYTVPFKSMGETRTSCLQKSVCVGGGGEPQVMTLCP